MNHPTLIYCAGGNRRFAEIAIAAGFRYGARLPSTIYHPLYFADQEWKKPDRARYMAALAEHRPQVATVLDWEREEQLGEVLSWAEEAAQYVETVIVIPKVVDQVYRIPRAIGCRPVCLGYSVPTAYGGTSTPGWEYAGRMVHLLGGSPQRQIREWSYLSAVANVVSVDGNMAQKMAVTRCCYWRRQAWGREGHWPVLKGIVSHDAPYEAFRLSCEAIHQAWEKM